MLSVSLNKTFPFIYTHLYQHLIVIVLQYLRNITVNIHSEVYTACTATRAETWLPVLTREEKTILTIIRQFLKVNQVIYLFNNVKSSFDLLFKECR